MSAPDPTSPPPASGILAAIVSELAGVATSEIGPGFSLEHAKLASSVGRAKLDAKLRRRLAVRLDTLGAVRTFGELTAAVLAAQGQPAPEVPPAGDGVSVPVQPSAPSALPVRHTTVPQAMSCGVDLERVGDLPECRDYWEEPFYQQHFTHSEIGYCLTQTNPRMHLAARWCLKEAVRKCGGEFALVEFRHMEVAHEESGAPAIRIWRGGAPEKAQLAVSLSHTDEWVVALAVRPPAPVVTVARPMEAAPKGCERSVSLAILISMVALGLACLALFQR